MPNNKTRVIKYLLSKERNYNNNKLSVEIGRETFEQSEISNIGETEFINQLSVLETEGFITVHFRSPRRDLAYFITVDLHEPIINYFENKKARKQKSRMDIIKWLAPLSISILSLLWNIINSLLYSRLHDMLLK